MGLPRDKPTLNPYRNTSIALQLRLTVDMNKHHRGGGGSEIRCKFIHQYKTGRPIYKIHMAPVIPVDISSPAWLGLLLGKQACNAMVGPYAVVFYNLLTFLTIIILSDCLKVCTHVGIWVDVRTDVHICGDGCMGGWRRSDPHAHPLRRGSVVKGPLLHPCPRLNGRGGSTLQGKGWRPLEDSLPAFVNRQRRPEGPRYVS